MALRQRSVRRCARQRCGRGCTVAAPSPAPAQTQTHLKRTRVSHYGPRGGETLKGEPQGCARRRVLKGESQGCARRRSPHGGA
eukprot:5318036-Prymnesium_polylepis.1